MYHQIKVHTLKKQPHDAFYEKTVLNNFALFTGKHHCWSFFSSEVKNFIKKRLQHKYNICFEEHLQTDASDIRKSICCIDRTLAQNVLFVPEQNQLKTRITVCLLY